jgi:hypothetical protein
VLCCAVLCCAVLCCAVLCCAVLCCAVLCCAVLCCAVLCCAVLCCAVRCCAVLCCAVLCCAVLCCAVLCCAVRRCACVVSPQHGTAEFEIHGNISFARNPTTVRCRGVDFGVASIDVLKYMNIATVSNMQSFKEPGRRVAVRAEQCLLQRSYMPIFPPPHNFPLDVSRLKQADMPTTPHVLLVPSDLKFMAKPVLDGQVMLINPCRLCKGEAAGTFARVFVPTGEAAAAPPAPLTKAAQEVTMEDAKDASDASKASAGDQDKTEEKPQPTEAAQPAAAAAAAPEGADLPMACDIQVEIVRV